MILWWQHTPTWPQDGKDGMAFGRAGSFSRQRIKIQHLKLGRGRMFREGRAGFRRGIKAARCWKLTGTEEPAPLLSGFMQVHADKRS